MGIAIGHKSLNVKFGCNSSLYLPIWLLSLGPCIALQFVTFEWCHILFLISVWRLECEEEDDMMLKPTAEPTVTTQISKTKSIHLVSTQTSVYQCPSSSSFSVLLCSTMWLILVALLSLIWSTIIQNQQKVCTYVQVRLHNFNMQRSFPLHVLSFPCPSPPLSTLSLSLSVSLPFHLPSPDSMARSPRLLVEVASLDYWDRYRAEGYGHVNLPPAPGTL